MFPFIVNGSRGTHVMLLVMGSQKVQKHGWDKKMIYIIRKRYKITTIRVRTNQKIMRDYKVFKITMREGVEHGD